MSAESSQQSNGSIPGGGMGKGAQIAIGVVIVASLLGWYGYTNLNEGASFQYFQSLDECLAAGPAIEGHALRVHGYVASQSIQRDLQGKRVEFRVQNDPPHAVGDQGDTLSVVYPSLETPDLFKDGAEVVLEGEMQRQGTELVFVADNVLAKCPSKFEAKLATEGGAEAGIQL
jgi:cytochrome c-type biogenesis protein CcmE